MIINIRISKKPNFIVLSNYGNCINYHFFLDNLSTLNKHSDFGIWKIKYKLLP